MSRTCGAFGASSCSVLLLDLQHLLSGSRRKQETQGGIVEARQTGNYCQPVQETEVPAQDQHHLEAERGNARREDMRFLRNQERNVQVDLDSKQRMRPNKDTEK